MLRNIIYIVAAACSVGGVAFFAGSETSFVSSNRFRVRSMAKKGIKGASLAQRLIENPATLLSVTLVGTNIFVVLSSSIATALLTGLLGRYSIVVSTIGITAVILVFGEIMPKAAARTDPEAFLARAAPGLWVAYLLLYPVARVTSSVASLFVAASHREHAGVVSRDEIRALVKEAAQSGHGYSAHGYAHRVLDLSRMKVTGVMVPMDEVISVDEKSTVNEALAAAARSGHSRYPVYRKTPDNIVGVLQLKHLLGAPESSEVRMFAQAAYFIPETKTVKAAIGEMRGDLRHMGVVTDEYGRPMGIVTFEDLVEEIMGEISDEYDQESGKAIGWGKIISGSTPVTAVNEDLDANIPEGAYDTIAGFILDRTGEVCDVGAVVEYGGIQLQVVEVKGKRIRRVRITRREKQSE
jgi:putative hemolysin